MIINKNLEEVKEGFEKGKIDSIHCLTPNIVDSMLEYAEKTFQLGSIMEEKINIKRHEDALCVPVFLYALMSSKAKQMFAISDAIAALTCQLLIDKYDINIKTENNIMAEGNLRNFINACSKNINVSDKEVKEEKKLREEKNKNKKDKNKLSLEEEVIKNELTIRNQGNFWAHFFNQTMQEIVGKVKEDGPNTFILDCVKMPVNIKNKNYELATVINYEGKAMRGYKEGVLRRATATGGIIELLIPGVISDNDMALVEKEITEYKGMKEGDYIVFDRGFAKIEFITSLVKRGINAIVPLKKNMNLYQECITQAKAAKEDEWKEHPNSKRKGQEILEITDLKGIWVPEKDQTKKPEKIMKNAIDFKACVIRIDKSKKENKNIIASELKARDGEDDTDVLYEDEQYIYIVIVSTDTTLTASQIVRKYELRPEIEEDFRQLKDVWNIASFTSTKYNFIMCQIALIFLAYNVFNLFRSSKAGEQYKDKSIQTIAKEEIKYKYPFDEVRYLIISNESYYVFSGIELLDLYATCDEAIRKKLRPLL